MKPELYGFSEVYKNHELRACGRADYWSLLIKIAPKTFVKSAQYFETAKDAIADGKAQIDILISKSLNIQP